MSATATKYVPAMECECLTWASADLATRRDGFHHPECPVGSERVTGLVMTRPGCGGWLYLGATAEEVGQALLDELVGDIELPADERSKVQIEIRDYTRDEIENMPDFEGW